MIWVLIYFKCFLISLQKSRKKLKTQLRMDQRSTPNLVQSSRLISALNKYLQLMKIVMVGTGKINLTKLGLNRCGVTPTTALWSWWKLTLHLKHLRMHWLQLQLILMSGRIGTLLSIVLRPFTALQTWLNRVFLTTSSLLHLCLLLIETFIFCNLFARTFLKQVTTQYLRKACPKTLRCPNNHTESEQRWWSSHSSTDQRLTKQAANYFRRRLWLLL